MTKLYFEVKKKFTTHIIALINDDLPIQENLKQIVKSVFHYFARWE